MRSLSVRHWLVLALPLVALAGCQSLQSSSDNFLGIPVRKVVIAVDAGRNLAVLVEAAVRNTVLQLRGIDTYREFIERHQKAMGKPE